jgi:predicted enzyme involved in methoxymalonyl-ACP biosynthesis
MITFNELKKNLKKDNSVLSIRKIALLGVVATQFLAISLKGMGYESSYYMDLFEAEFNQVERQVIDTKSDLHKFGADYVIVFQSTHNLLEVIRKDEEYVTFSYTLADKFGDHGLIRAIILKKLDVDTLFVDSWFMYCRVFKRGMEDFTLSTLVNYANEKGFKNIIGEYLPTAKKNMVSNHFSKLGFETIQSQNRYSLSCMLALTKTKNFISHANKQNGI